MQCHLNLAGGDTRIDARRRAARDDLYAFDVRAGEGRFEDAVAGRPAGAENGHGVGSLVVGRRRRDDVVIEKYESGNAHVEQRKQHQRGQQNRSEARKSHKP